MSVNINCRSDKGKHSHELHNPVGYLCPVVDVVKAIDPARISPNVERVAVKEQAHGKVEQKPVRSHTPQDQNDGKKLILGIPYIGPVQNKRYPLEDIFQQVERPGMFLCDLNPVSEDEPHNDQNPDEKLYCYHNFSLYSFL